MWPCWSHPGDVSALCPITTAQMGRTTQFRALDKKKEKNKSRWMHENASTHMKPPVSSPQAPQHDITGARWRPWCRDILTLCVYDLEVNWTNQGPIQSGTCGTCHGPLSLHKTFKTSRNPAAFLAFTPQQTQLPLTHCASFPGRRT